MITNKVLSVIIPSYNVEKYLHKTLDSICSISNIKDVEVIVVNDGSKDKTIEKASEFHDIYPDSIVVIDKENGGHGSTINAGLSVATGRYFKVIDGDDWVDSDCFESFVDRLKQIDVDLVLTPFTKVYEDVGDKEAVYPNLKVPEGALQFSEYINDIAEFYCMHAITFKTEMYKKNMHPITEHCFYVDMEFILYPIDYINSFEYLDFNIYQYRLGRPGQSVSMESKIKNKDMHKKVISDIIANCIVGKKTNRDKNVENYVFHKVVTLLNIQYSIYLTMKPNKSTYSEMKKFMNSVDSAVPGKYLYGVSKIIHFIPLSYWMIGFRYRRVYA